MKIQSLKLVYFSPTGTTKAIVQGIARGINQKNIELLDITKPGFRQQSSETDENDLLIVGVPVYMGRVPALLNEWFQALKANNTPVICAVVYGNRAYEDALLELKNVLIQQGCVPIAGAAFIGEHSFSTPEIPTAEGRPDTIDLNKAESFGRKIHEKLNSISSTQNITDLQIPGNFPYGGITTLWDVDFITINKEECSQCGICAESCPVGAIDPENSQQIDIKKCITCCACIKNCPQNARTIKPGVVKDASIRLNSLYAERKEPEYFL